MNIFLDCGSHLGEGLLEFHNKFKFDENWMVYSFEPNPNCKDYLENKLFTYTPRPIYIDYKEMKNNFYEIYKKNNELEFEIKFIYKAVWINNDELEFQIDASDNDDIGEGSQLYDIGYRKENYSKPIIVECLDFSEFVNKLPNVDIYCKMDIEGAEFNVLEKMIKDNTITKIKELYCEFHGMVGVEKFKEKDKLIDKIKTCGVIVYDWK